MVKNFYNSLNFLSGFTHTGGVENLFSLQGKYATKQIFFRCKDDTGIRTYFNVDIFHSQESMLCKNALTAIDHNRNCNRSQVSVRFS